MAITDTLNLTPQLVAEQNPELHEMRKIAFGENYLQDIEGGTGTAQYYSGWGNVPSWAQQAMTTDEAYTTPAVTGTTTNIGVGGGPDAGIMSVAPTAGAVSGIPGSMPTVPAGGMEGGVWGPMSYLQPPLDQAGAVAAMTTPEAYGTDPFAFEDTRALAARNIEPIDPYGFEDTKALAARGIVPTDPFAFEDTKALAARGIEPEPILPQAKPIAEDVLPEGFDPFFSLEAPGITPFTPETILPEAKPDIYTDRIMDPNLMRIEQERAVQDAPYPIAGLSTEQKQLYNQLGTSNLIDPADVNKDKYGKNIITGADTLDVLGNTYEEGVREYVEKYGDKEYTTPLAQQKQKDYKALVDAWDERDAVTGILPPGILSVAPTEMIEPKTYAEKAEDVWKDIEIISPIAGVELFVNTKTGDTGSNIEDVIEKPEPTVTTAVAPPSVLAPPLPPSGPTMADVAGPVRTAREDETRGDAQIATQIAAQDRAFSGYDAGGYDPAPPPAESWSPAAGSGGSDDSSSGGKIVCTMMNNSYGFGSFRNKIWLRHSKNLASEYQKGYHKIFLPLVNYAKQTGFTNKIVKKVLEHIAVHRTIDIRQEARGKRHMLGRIYRKVLEPICYWVGRYGKRT